MEVRQFCPQCKSIELEIKRSPLIDIPSTAYCGHCGWSGEAADAAAVISHEHMHGAEDVALRMLHTIVHTAAGPLVTTMSQMGLIAKKKRAHDGRIYREEAGLYEYASEAWSADDIADYNALIDEVRGEILKAIFEVSIGAAFEAAGAANERVKGFQPKGTLQ